jgi:hypothetical protein
MLSPNTFCNWGMANILRGRLNPLSAGGWKRLGEAVGPCEDERDVIPNLSHFFPISASGTPATIRRGQSQSALP